MQLTKYLIMLMYLPILIQYYYKIVDVVAAIMGLRTTR